MKRKYLVGIALLGMGVAAGWFFQAHLNAAGQIGPNAADPAYIVVNTPTQVTFTSVIADSNLRKHDPKKVLLVRTDASGAPIDIVGRMRDNGRKADADRNDRTYTVQTTLNEPTVGTIHFRIAAKFKQPRERDTDGDDDWDGDLRGLSGQNRRELLPNVLRKLKPYTLSQPIAVAVWNVADSPATGYAVGYPPSMQAKVTNNGRTLGMASHTQDGEGAGIWPGGR